MFRPQRLAASYPSSVLDFWNNPLRIFAAHELAAIIDPAMTTKMTVQVRIYKLIFILFFKIFLSFFGRIWFVKGSFNNYVDIILPFFDPHPLHGQFLSPKRGQNRHSLTPSPPHLVHVVIE